MGTYLEKEIESRFIDWSIGYTNPMDRNKVPTKVWKYLGRQIRLPFGVCDVLLFNVFGRFGFDVVEVKKDVATDKTIAQVFSYVAQFDQMLFDLCSSESGESWYNKNPHRGNSRAVIVAPKLDGEFINRCHAVGVFDFVRVVENKGVVEFEFVCPEDKSVTEEAYLDNRGQWDKIFSTIPEVIKELQYVAWEKL